MSGNLRVETAVGNIYAHLARTRPLENSVLTTGAGDITVYIPADFPLTIRAENASPEGSRSIVSAFPGTPIRSVGPLAVIETKVHGGGPLLRLAGTGGTISILKLEKQDE